MSKLLTDTEISSKTTKAQRKQLQAWTDIDTTSVPLIELDEEARNGDTSWDQFAVNQEKFGVTSTYRYEIYTTELDKDSEEYKLRAAEAERLAREIESEYTDNVHLAEERGQKLEDDGIDEEDRYSSVLRTPPTPKYVPPARRRGQQDSGEMKKEHSPTDELENTAKARRNSRGLMSGIPRSPKLGGKSSPVGSPTLSKLNVDPTSANFNEHQIQQFQNFLQESTPSRDQQTEELKQFSKQLEKKGSREKLRKPASPSEKKETSDKKEKESGDKKEGGTTTTTKSFNPDAQEFRPGMGLMSMLGVSTTPSSGPANPSSGPKIISTGATQPAMPVSPVYVPQAYPSPTQPPMMPASPVYYPGPSNFGHYTDTRLSLTAIYGSRMKRKVASGNIGGRGGGSETWIDPSMARRKSYTDPLPISAPTSPSLAPTSPPPQYYGTYPAYEPYMNYPASPQSPQLYPQNPPPYGIPQYYYPHTAPPSGYYPPSGYPPNQVPGNKPYLYMSPQYRFK